jgi:homogentisate 1,2-dioxygenase
MVMQHTFRPPYFVSPSSQFLSLSYSLLIQHRNTMSEYMGLINGVYDNKARGFEPGGSSLHLTMTPHGPDTITFEKASNEGDANGVQQPVYFSGGLAFMFETCYILQVSASAIASPNKDLQYLDCWQTLPKAFTPTDRQEEDSK